jgi:23S rRNA (guanosine2251-2'-O)-methyltransferase
MKSKEMLWPNFASEVSNMCSEKRRRTLKRQVLGSHQKCWIWGRNTVLETLRAGRWQVLELCLADHLPADAIETARQLARQQNVGITIEPAAALTRRCHASEHQGYLAKMTPYPYLPASDILGRSTECPFYAILDSLKDPQNFGTIIRSAAAMGVDALFVCNQRQVKVTSAVARSSAGMVNWLPIAQVDDLCSLAWQLRDRGVQVVGASPTASATLHEYDFRRPTAIVVGNEATGIQSELLEACDAQVSIPQAQNIDSLNVAASASILFYEVRRQRAW